MRFIVLALIALACLSDSATAQPYTDGLYAEPNTENDMRLRNTRGGEANIILVYRLRPWPECQALQFAYEYSLPPGYNGTQIDYTNASCPIRTIRCRGIDWSCAVGRPYTTGFFQTDPSRITLRAHDGRMRTFGYLGPPFMRAVRERVQSTDVEVVKESLDGKRKVVRPR